MSTLKEAFTLVAPWYNLAMILVGLYLFFVLSKIKNNSINLAPWKFVFAALGVGLIEELTIVLRSSGVISVPIHINGFFEVIIIGLLLYTLFLKRKILR
ncbi:hypothetical protein HZA97_07290 [Candidatus Woesearchaeota archaeon]|nr:hypothetical protein [Candidatus Woesearchaeota archaeon]